MQTALIKKIAAVSTERSLVTIRHVESCSADKLATLIETLVLNNFDVED
jgi:hypothetical protein